MTTKTEEKVFSISALALRSAVCALVAPKKLSELGDEDTPEFARVPEFGKLLDRRGVKLLVNYNHGWAEIKEHNEETHTSYNLRYHLGLAGFQEVDRIALYEKDFVGIRQLLNVIDNDAELKARYREMSAAELELSKKYRKDCDICTIL